MHLFREHDDQFVMLIENITKRICRGNCKSILKNISEYFVIEEEDVYLSASIGIVMAPADGEDEKYYFRESMLCFRKSKRKRKRTLSFLL